MSTAQTADTERKHNERVRRGAAALALSAVLFAAFPLLHPFPGPAEDDPAAWAEGVTSTPWVLGHLLNIASLVTLLLGLLALYGALSRSAAERTAFTGLVLGLVGIGLTLPTGGVETFAQPAIGRVQQQSGGEVFRVAMELYTRGPGGPTILLGLLLLDAAAILFVVAVWRSRLLPRVAAVVFALGLVLFFPLAPPIVRITGGLLTGIGGLWLAWAMRATRRERQPT